MNLTDDKRVVLTLDAGGTNFVFSAIQANEENIAPVIMPSQPDNLDKCLNTLIEGFRKTMAKIKTKAVAISFAFPGPADYPQGIIGDLNNLPAFRGGIPLGPILKNEFGLPVFINNDGDLYAYGEALSGFLPYINGLLRDSENPKTYHNLIGVTLGTGFGGGIVRNMELIIGDNSMAAEVWLLRNRLSPEMNAEEGVSIRAIQRVYAQEAGIQITQAPEPKIIYEVAMGKSDGSKKAAIEAFRQLGKVLGDALAQVITLIDGIVVIGGGISGAMPLIFPAMLEEIRSNYIHPDGKQLPRLVQHVMNLDDEADRKEFLVNKGKIIHVPGTNEKLTFTPKPVLGIGTSRIGTSRAIALGAYAFALKSLDSRF